MKILDYLKAIKECHEEYVKFDKRQIHRLTYDYGIYTNFGILLAGKLGEVISGLRKTGEFGEVNGFLGQRILGHLPAEIVTILWQEGNTYGALILLDELTKNMGAREYYKTCSSKFKSHLLLHEGNPANRTKAVSWERAFAIAIDRISRYLIETNTSFCFPNSKGWKSPKDLTQIVYFPDELEEKMRRLT